MTRQGPELAIGQLHPLFVNCLAAAIAEARGSGLPLAGIFSAYRLPSRDASLRPYRGLRFERALGTCVRPVDLRARTLPEAGGR